MKNWITEKIELNNEKDEIKRFLFKKLTCNSKDEIIDETEFDSKSNIVCKRVYRYFDTGAVKEYVEYDPLDNLLERHSYYKNEDGIIVKSIFEYAEDQKVIKSYKVSDFGNIDKVTLTDNDGIVLGYEAYVFDEVGNMTEEIELDEMQNEVSKFVKEYDDNDYLITEKQYLDGQLNNITEFAYDQKGLLKSKTFKNLIEKYQVLDDYHYDLAGNMIYNSCHHDGILVFENKCKYNIDNKLIEEEFFEIDIWEKRVSRHEKLVHKED